MRILFLRKSRYFAVIYLSVFDDKTLDRKVQQVVKNEADFIFTKLLLAWVLPHARSPMSIINPPLVSDNFAVFGARCVHVFATFGWWIQIYESRMKRAGETHVPTYVGRMATRVTGRQLVEIGESLKAESRSSGGRNQDNLRFPVCNKFR